MDPIYQIKTNGSITKYVDLDKLIAIEGPMPICASYKIELHFQLSEKPLIIIVSESEPFTSIKEYDSTSGKYIYYSSDEIKQFEEESQLRAEKEAIEKTDEILNVWKQYKESKK